eukprot:6193212-Pleurochrysis_carterae.AAC.1
MPMRALLSLGMCVTAAALKMPASTGRRSVLRKAALASTTTALPALLPVLPAGAESSVSDMAPFRPEAEFTIERTISELELYSGVETAPPRVVVLTGANSGIGFAAAKLLTAAGHTVICACRLQAKADETARACMQYAAENMRREGGIARGMECNLADLKSVRAFARQLEGTPIDTLALNAGLALNTGDKAAQRTADGFELTVGTNHLGHFLLANLLVRCRRGFACLQHELRAECLWHACGAGPAAREGHEAAHRRHCLECARPVVGWREAGLARFTRRSLGP